MAEAVTIRERKKKVLKWMKERIWEVKLRERMKKENFELCH